MNTHRRRRDDFLPLFAPPAHNGTATSMAAALDVAPKVNRQAAKVLDWLKAHGAASRKRIALGAGLPLQSVCARVNALVRLGLICPAGEAIEDNRRVELVKAAGV